MVFQSKGKQTNLMRSGKVYLTGKSFKPEVGYDPDLWANILKVFSKCQENQVGFFYCLSPGLSLEYSSEEDFNILLTKFSEFYQAGQEFWPIF